MTLSRPAIVLIAAAAAVVVNLAVYLVGGAAGASFAFPDGTLIPWFVVVLFSAVPLALALTAVALLAPRWRWVIPAALVAAPVLGLVSIPLMPVPVGFDLGTTVALSLMHVTVGVAGLLGVLALRARLGARAQSASRSTIGSSASA